MKKSKLAVGVALAIASTAHATPFEPLTTSATSAQVESTAPFLLPKGWTQTLVTDVASLTAHYAATGRTFPSTFHDWDMIDFGGADNQFIYIPFEVQTGAGVARFNRTDNTAVTLLQGNNTGIFESNPGTWDKLNDDFGAFDPAVVTPTGSLVVAEEWSGNGRIFELLNPETATSPVDANWQWLSKVPSVSHEGVKFDSSGVMYFIDEYDSGSIYKFVPSTAGDYSTGQTFVLKVDAYAGNASESYGSASNSAAARTGAASWVAMTDAAGNALTTANPFDYTSRGGRAAADELNGTPYGRPEDLEISKLANGNEVIYFTTTSENIVYSIELLNAATATVREFVNSAVTPDTIGNSPVGEGANDATYGLDDPDNLEVDARGNVFIIEDEDPSDIWMATDADKDGVAESVSLFASLGPFGSESTGFIADPNDPYTFYVNIQHPSTGNDALWAIHPEGTQFAPLTATATSAQNESTHPFALPPGWAQSLVADIASMTAHYAATGRTFPATFHDWDMINFGGPNARYIYIPFEVQTGAGVVRFDRTDSSAVTLIQGNNTGIFESNPGNWNKLNDDFGAFDPAVVTPTGSLVVAEEWSGNGRIFELLNPETATSPADANWQWLSKVPSVSHEGIKFDSKGAMYFIDEYDSGSIYKFVPSTAGDYSTGQTFVLKVDAYAGNADESYSSASNSAAVRTGSASWVAMTDAAGNALTSANPFDYTSRGGRAAADELGGTPYGRPEDLEVGHLANGTEVLYFATTSENIIYVVELLNATSANIGEFVNSAVTPDTIGNNPVGEGTNDASYGLDDPDNLAQDHAGNLFIIEDEDPSDIWMATDADKDGVAESVSLFASLGPFGSESTGFIADPAALHTFYVDIQHPSSGNDALWKIFPAQDGDADANGTIDNADVLKLRTFLRQSASACPQCDMNDDGTISAADLRLLVLKIRTGS